MNTQKTNWKVRLVNALVVIIVMIPLFFGGVRTARAAATIYVNYLWAGTTVGADPDGAGPATSFGTDSFAKIQEGVTAAAIGDTVLVYAGTYAEQVVIIKNITLIAAGVAVITPPDNLVVHCDTGSLINYPLVCVDGVNADIDGFTIDGQSKADQLLPIDPLKTEKRYFGISYLKAGGNVTNNTIVGIRSGDVPNKNFWRGVGIYVYNAQNTVSVSINIKGNTINTFQKNGITVTTQNWNAPIISTIENNTITGTPSATVIQNGIQVDTPHYLSQNDIKGNTISNIAYNNAPPAGGTKDPWMAVSILNLNSNTTTSNNTITGAQVGIVYQSGGSVISGNTIQVIKPGTTTNPGRNVYGILVSSRELKTLSPIDPPVGGLSLNAVISSDAQFDILNNTITYNGALLSTNTYGIEIDAGYDADIRPFMLIGNQVGDVGKGFDKGIGIIQCDLAVQADCLSSGYFASSSIQNNNLYNNNYGIYFTGPIALGAFDTFNHNRIFGNTTAGAVNNTGQEINMQNNWWGCNTGPNTTGCDKTVTVLDLNYDPWLILTAALNPATLPGGNTATMTANLNFNSNLVDTTVVGQGPVNTTAAFAATLGSFTPTSATFSSGTATSTYTAPAAGGTDSACVTVDSQQVCLDVPTAPGLITSLDLLESADNVSWTKALGSYADGFTVLLDPTKEFYYLNADKLLTTRPTVDGLYPFKVNTYPANFFTYWFGKGVSTDAPPDTWQGLMWQIINGNLPIFYLQVSGTSTMLVDGLQYAASLDPLNPDLLPLRIYGDYPIGAYTYTGSINDTDGFTNQVNVGMNVAHFPVLSSTDLAGPYVALTPQEFNVTLDNASGAAYTNVLVRFRVAGAVPADIASLEYWDTTSSSWLPLPLTVDGSDLVGSYGPPAGFPMAPDYNATSLFRVTFNTPKSYDVTATLVNLTPTPELLLATLTQTAVVNAPLPTLSSSDLTGPYLTNLQQEFQVTLNNANGAAYTNVLAHFRIAGAVPADIASLEYWEPTSSSWQVLPLIADGADMIGDYGPAAGFPMATDYNVTSLFRVTFNTAKSYNVTVTLGDLTKTPEVILATLTQTAVVKALPTLSSSDLIGPYTTTFAQQFHVTLDNANGAVYTQLLERFRIASAVPTDVKSLEYQETLTGPWLPITLTADGADLIGSYGGTGFPMASGDTITPTFRITFNTAKTYDVTVTLVDLTFTPERVLTTMTKTAVVKAASFIFLPLISR